MKTVHDSPTSLENSYEGSPEGPSSPCSGSNSPSPHPGSSPPNSYTGSTSPSSTYSSSWSPEMKELHVQFNNQELLLGQLRDALEGNKNNQRPMTHETKDYASDLACRRSTREDAGLVPSTKQEERVEEVSSGGKTTETETLGVEGARRMTQTEELKTTKIEALRAQLEESKARQDREERSRLALDKVVGSLQRELAEWDVLIGSSPRSDLGSSTSDCSDEGLDTPYWDWEEEASVKENQILELNEVIAGLNKRIFDLEGELSAKNEAEKLMVPVVLPNTNPVIEKSTIESEAMDECWREKEEAKILLHSALARVDILKETNKRLEESKEEVTKQNRELKEQIYKKEVEFDASRRRARDEKILLEAKMEEIEEERSEELDLSKGKEDIFEERIRKLEESRNIEGLMEEEIILELENSLTEAVKDKTELQLQVIKLQEVEAFDKKLKTRLKEAEEAGLRLTEELNSRIKSSKVFEGEKLVLMEKLAARDTEVVSLKEEVEKIVVNREEIARGRLELEVRCGELEEQRDGLKQEQRKLIQEMEQKKDKEKSDLEILAGLKVTQSTLEEEHERLQKVHESAMQRITWYDNNLLEKTRKIKEQQIDLKTLENMLHEKTKEISCLVTNEGHHQSGVVKANESNSSSADYMRENEIELTECEYLQLVPPKDLHLEEDLTNIETLNEQLLRKWKLLKA